MVCVGERGGQRERETATERQRDREKEALRGRGMEKGTARENARREANTYYLDSCMSQTNLRHGFGGRIARVHLRGREREGEGRNERGNETAVKQKQLRHACNIVVTNRSEHCRSLGRDSMGCKIKEEKYPKAAQQAQEYTTSDFSKYSF